MDEMLNLELQRFEGVWTGTEHVSDGVNDYHSSGRLVFQTVFDGRFLLCDYVQTAPERPTGFAHGVFRRDDESKALTVTWFRSPTATASQQANAVAEGDKPIFYETGDACTTRTAYVIVMNRLTVCTDRARGDSWERIFEGTYRRR
jgi:hypothetical protein